jgi:hypothetical protein
MNRTFINANGENIDYDISKPVEWRFSIYGVLLFQEKIVLVKQ